MNKCVICGKKIRGDWHMSMKTMKFMHAVCSRLENVRKKKKIKYIKTTDVPGSWTRHANVERDVYADDLIQPLKKTGEINERFIKANGTKELQKQWKMSDREIRQHAK